MWAHIMYVFLFITLKNRKILFLEDYWCTDYGSLHKTFVGPRPKVKDKETDSSISFIILSISNLREVVKEKK